VANIEVLKYEQMGPEAQEALSGVKKKLGKIPNAYGVMAQSPATLKAYFSFRRHLSQGVLSQQEREAIALVIAQATDCLYCLASHTVIAKMQGIPETEIMLLRKAKSGDPKLAALVKLAKDIYINHGHPSQENITAFFKAGYDQSALVEVIAQVSLNVFTGFLNKTAKIPVDYPVVQKIE